MDNNLDALNNVLYKQLEILNNADIEHPNYKKIKDKALSISSVGQSIIKSTEVQLKAAVFAKSFSVPSSTAVGIESHE